MNLLPSLLLALCMAVVPDAPAQSLYRESTFMPLIADAKARAVGDPITVQVLETSSASSSTDTGTRRANDLGAALTHQDNRLVGRLGIETRGEFDGGGRTQRATRLLATLSATVVEVLPNGDLRIAGEQKLTVNEELQRVTLEGRVRPRDISEANVVLSTRLADARISYEGQGEVSDRARRGAWRRLVDWLGL